MGPATGKADKANQCSGVLRIRIGRRLVLGQVIKERYESKTKEDGNRNNNKGCEGNWLRDRSSPAEAGDRPVSTGTGLCGIRTRNKSGK